MKADLVKEFLGKDVTLTTTSGSVYHGRIIAFSEEPTVELHSPTSGRVTLTARVINGIALAGKSKAACSHCDGTGVAP